ncbi:hypothetical protein HOD88_00300 [archaeon]|jgi:hypothetical protein|nr:hypothetical protein [archaeon]
MRGKLLFGFLIALILLANVNAVESIEVTIKTVANAEVQVSFFDSTMAKPELLDRVSKQADKYGDVEIIFSSSAQYYKIMATAHKNDKMIMPAKILKEQIAGKPIYIELLPEGIPALQNPEKLNITDIPENETIIELNETEIISNVSNEEQNSSITGFAISENLISNSLTWIVAIAIILGIGGTFFVKKKKKKKSKKGNEIKITKLSDKKKEEDEEKKKTGDELKEAEENLKELQEKVRKLKEQKEKSPKQIEIDKIKQRMIEDEKKLMELRNKE